MADFHKYIYDLENKKIRGDFEGAYKSSEVIWSQQYNMEAPHFAYIRGLILERKLELGNMLSVLDIGCGYGAFVNNLNKYKVGKVVGYDISKTAIEIGKKKFGEKLDTRVGSLDEISVYKSKFDFVLLLGVLWFLLDDLPGAIKKIKKLMCPQSEFILTLNIPKDPIGKEIIKDYNGLVEIISDSFEIIDVFYWYQEETIKLNEFSEYKTDMLIRCKL